MRTILCVSAAVLFFASGPNPAMGIRIVTYNLLNYGSGRTTEFKTVLNGVLPDVLIIQEINDLTAVNYFRDYVLNAADGPGGGTGTYAAATFYDNGSLNNALFYHTAKFTYGGAADHTYLPKSAGYYPRVTDRWKVGLAGVGVQFYVYSMHLSADNPTYRENQTRDARDDANSLPQGTHLIYAGDFNIDSSYETSYQNLVGSEADNDGRGFDPINMPGHWNGSYTFRFIHTQSTHANGCPDPPPGAAAGGLDDRFDFLLVSTALNDTGGLSYVSGTYQAYGNDGEHLNECITDPPPIPDADELHGASDHLPVVMDLQAPAQIPYIDWLVFEDAIVGDDATEPLTVYNSGDLGLFGYVDDLEYSLEFDEPSDFSARPGTFIDPPGGGGNTHDITMETDTSGDKFDVLHINNNSLDTPVRNVTVIGTVYDRGDLSRNFSVDLADVGLFIDVLLDPDAASAFDRRLADMDGNDTNDGRDIQGFVDALMP